MTRNRVDMDRRIGRSADRRAGDDRVLEGRARQDVRGLYVLMHDLYRRAGRFRRRSARVRDTAPESRRNRAATCRALPPAHSWSRRCPWCCNDRSRAPRTRRWRGIPCSRSCRPRDPCAPATRCAGAGALALPPAVEHRSARQHDRRDVDGCGRHQRGRRGLVAAGGQHDAVERIAVQHLDQAEIGEIAVERGGRPLAGFLDRMASGIRTRCRRLRECLRAPAAPARDDGGCRATVAAGLRDPDDRLARRSALRSVSP